MSSIEIKKIGITKLNTDSIVNAANEGLWQGGGVCGAIFNEAGPVEMTKACRSIGGCKIGNAVITPGFKLPAKYVIHAVGPKWLDGEHNEPKLLYSAYKQSLTLARENKLHSIGFPLISAGIYGYPKDKAWRKAIQACHDFIRSNEDYEINIVFAVLDDMIYAIGQQTLGELSREMGCLDYEKIHNYAVKYLELYSTADNQCNELESVFGDDCFGVGFEMDCGKAFIEAYGHDAIDNVEGLQRVIEEISDPLLLGSGIFSKWRGITHWTYDSVVSETNRPWFTMALSRLEKLTKDRA